MENMLAKDIYAIALMERPGEDNVKHATHALGTLSSAILLLYLPFLEDAVQALVEQV
jgi:hypothetical protein